MKKPVKESDDVLSLKLETVAKLPTDSFYYLNLINISDKGIGKAAIPDKVIKALYEHDLIRIEDDRVYPLHDKIVIRTEADNSE